MPTWHAGIFTERDVLRAAAAGGELSTEHVFGGMTPDPVTAPPGTHVDDATETLIGGRFRHLPVVEGATAVGIVSLRDLLGAPDPARLSPAGTFGVPNGVARPCHALPGRATLVPRSTAPCWNDLRKPVVGTPAPRWARGGG